MVWISGSSYEQNKKVAAINNGESVRAYVHISVGNTVCIFAEKR
jgi:hypothetical protein